MSGYSAAGALLAKYPNLNVVLKVTNWREVTRLVAETKVELGVAELTDAVLDESLGTELVGEHRARFFCSPNHPILEGDRITLAELLRFPWATTRIPPRLAAAFPRSTVPAGHIDGVNGEFVPAIEMDVPMQLGNLAAGGNVIAVGSLSMAEQELKARRLALIPTLRVNVRASYGFIYVKHRSIAPAIRAFMEELRHADRRCAEREQELERHYATARDQY